MNTNRHEWISWCSSASVRRIFVSLGSAARGAATTLLIFACFCSISSFAQVPLQFTYQGRLTNSNGIPVTTSVTGIFRIVKGGTITNGGQEVYAQTNDVTPDVNGVFSVVIGAPPNPIPLTAIADGTSSNRYIEAVINNETNLPRQQMLAVPFASVAQTVQGPVLSVESNGNVRVFPLATNTLEGGQIEIFDPNPGVNRNGKVIVDNYNEVLRLFRTKSNPVEAYFFADFYSNKTHFGIGSSRVGIGTPDPAAKLHVAGGLRANKGSPSSDTSNVGYAFEADGDTGLFAYGGNSGAGSELGLFRDNVRRLYIDSNNNLVVDTDLYVNGTAFKTGTLTWQTWSDSRLKVIDGEYKAGLSKILGLRPIVYRYAEGNALGIADLSPHVGLVAQEVREFLPEAVSSDEAKGYLTLNIDPIIMALINAIKEQQAQIDALRQQVERLGGGEAQ